MVWTRLRGSPPTWSVWAFALSWACAPDVEPWLRKPSNRAVLFAGLRSYASVADVAKQLGVKTWTTRTDRRGRSRGCLSRSFDFHVAYASVGYVSHLDHGGPLELVFLNDRLVRVTFRPRAPAAYLRALMQQGRLRGPGGQAALPTPLPKRVRLEGGPAHTRIEVRRDRRGARVVWADERLLRAYWEVQSRGSSRYMK